MSPERIAAWEAGTATPTLSQLRKVASTYKRSLGVFFLVQQPAATVQPTDYRRLELSMAHTMSTELANALRAAEAKRAAALEIYEQLDEEPPPFALNVPPDAPAELVGARVLERLGITMEHRRGWPTEYEALNYWKAAVEGLGVLVMQASGVAVSEMRGCALALYPLPVIVLNSSDRPLGRVFSLLHELAHLARSEHSLCDVNEEVDRGVREQTVEVYCNRVAGSALVPSESLLSHPLVQAAAEGQAWDRGAIDALRRQFWASRESILRRLLTFGKTSQEFYRAERARMREQFANDEGANSKGFVTVPRRVVLANGRFLTGLVVDAYDSSVITGSELSRILGTKLDHLPKIVDVLRERAAA